MKKKKKLFPLISAVVLLAATLLMIFRPSGNMDNDSRDFSVKDTSRISKVFLGDRSGNALSVVRGKDGGFRVNDSLPANPETLKRLMKVIHSVEVKSRVAKSAYNNVVGDMAAAATKVEIYLDGDDRPIKTYYVGGHTQDPLGTFMMLEGGASPFITELPGFNGYLTPWYPTRIEDWVRNVVFDYESVQIASVEITYPAFPERSFRFMRKDSSYFVSRQGATGKEFLSAVSRTSAMNYLVHFRGLPFMQDARMLGPRERDSLDKVVPLAKVSVTDNKGESKSITLYPMPISDRSLVKEDDKGRPLEYDLDHMYCRLNRAPYWVVVQHYTFDPVLQRYEDLARQATLTD